MGKKKKKKKPSFVTLIAHLSPAHLNQNNKASVGYHDSR